MNLNKTQLIGRVTRDPELRAMPNGGNVAKFGLATNYIYKTKSGEKKETVQFHNCVAFGRLAEIINQYVVKGQELYVEGRIEYRQWEKKDGTKAYATEIVIENMQMGQKARGSNEQRDAQREKKEEDTEEEEINVEEIPF